MSRTPFFEPTGQSFTIEPVTKDVCEILARTFYTVNHELSRESPKRLVKRHCPLFRIGRDCFGERAIIVPRGLFSLVVDTLARHGIRVDGDLPMLPVLRQPDTRSVRKKLSPVDFHLLHAVQHTDRALIRYGRRVDVAQLIAEVALAWDDRTVLVLVKRVKDATSLKRRLRNFLPEVQCFHHLHNPDTRCRVAISTYAYANNSKTGVTKRDIVLAMSPADLVMTENGIACVNKMWIARLYGFMTERSDPEPYVDDWITALFGPNEVAIPARGRHYRQISVVFSPLKGGARPPRTVGTLQLKKAGIWKHRVRNRRVAAVARALAEGELDDLDACFAEAFEPWQPLASRIAVLVENVAHALELSKRLPNWIIVTGPDVCVSGLTPAERDKLKRRADSWQRDRRLIVTHSALERVRQLDVLVRADGGTGLPELPHRVATANESIPPLLLVDFTDKHHPQLRRRSRQRRNEYLDAGWSIAGEERLTVLERFLATRPQVEST